MGLLEDLDPRNDPAGYPATEPPQRYRIREVVRPRPFGARYQLRGTGDPEYELGNVVERMTSVSFDTINHAYYHALHEADQLYADLCSRTAQEACRWFYDPEWQPMPGVADIAITDDEVRESIRRLDLGENKREADRTFKPRFVLSELPWTEQRSLIERLYALRREFQFEKLGPVVTP
jgi:hypothetical protein